MKPVFNGTVVIVVVVNSYFSCLPEACASFQEFVYHLYQRMQWDLVNICLIQNHFIVNVLQPTSAN